MSQSAFIILDFISTWRFLLFEVLSHSAFFTLVLMSFRHYLSLHI
jgi:hypothetical protein